MLNSKYASKSDESRGVVKTHKYDLDELHKELGIESETPEEDSAKKDRVVGHLEQNVHDNNDNGNFDEDMMDLDDENEVSFVSDLIQHHRDGQHYNESDSMDLSLDLATGIDRQNDSPTIAARTVLVVDTNFIVSHLNTLEQLRLLSAQYHHRILIPTTVVQELDGLKNSDKVTSSDYNSRHQSLGELARAANDWIYKQLANLESSVIVQKMNQRYNYSLTKDDAILDCCLYFAQALQDFVVLLSNDKNLCLRALSEHLLTVSYRKGMTAELIASMVYKENLATRQKIQVPKQFERDPSYNGVSSSDFHALAVSAYDEFFNVIVEAIDRTMIRIYGDELMFTSYSRKEMTDFKAVTRVIYKHYIAVFSDFFRNSGISHNDWKQLPNELVEVPVSIHQLKAFVTFWSKIVQALCKEDASVDSEASSKFFHTWLQRCSELGPA